MAPPTRIHDGFLPGRSAITGFGQGGFLFADMSHKGSIAVLPSGFHAIDLPEPFRHDESHYAGVFAEAADIDILLVGDWNNTFPPAGSAALAVSRAANQHRRYDNIIGLQHLQCAVWRGQACRSRACCRDVTAKPTARLIQPLPESVFSSQMITRKRFRNILLALGFYALSGAAVGYFAYHAHHGERGLHAKAGFKIRIAQLDAEIRGVQQEKMDWERRVSLLRADNLDRDLLDERARTLLNTAHKNDVIVILPQVR